MKAIYFSLIITILLVKLVEIDAVCSIEGDTCFFFSCCDGSECRGIFKRQCVAIPNSDDRPHSTPTIKPTPKITPPKDKLTTTSEITTTPLSTTTTTLKPKPPQKETTFTTVKFITKEYLRKHNLTDGLDEDDDDEVDDNLNEIEDENLELNNDKTDNIEGQ